MRELGVFVQRRRIQLGKRGDLIAVSIGKSPSWISRLESGLHKTLPEPEVLRALAAQLDVSVVDLLVGAGYLERDDVDHALKEKNPFPPGDSRHDIVELLLTEAPDPVALSLFSSLASFVDRYGAGRDKRDAPLSGVE